MTTPTPNYRGRLKAAFAAEWHRVNDGVEPKNCRRLTPNEILDVATTLAEKFVVEALESAKNEWREAQPKKPKQKKASEMTDQEWVASMEAEPALKGINIKQEIARAQLWCRQNNRQPTRRFLVNWFSKAERVVDLKAAGGQFATGLKPAPPPAPEGWREWLAANMPADDHPAHGQVLTAYNCQNFYTLPASWQARCQVEMVAATLTNDIKQDAHQTRLRHA